MSIAVIIPVLNEQDMLPPLLNALLPLGFEEVILVDGDSQDRSVEVAKTCLKTLCHPYHRIISGPKGRATQMNIEQSLSNPHSVGGRFDVRFPRDRGYAWMVSRMMNLRSRLSGICTGDQAMFVRRAVFESMGGFADMPLMEDIEFSRRLKQKGAIIALRETVVTSFRRWEQQGPLRTILRMWILRLFYWAGWEPQRLQQYYHHVR